MSAPNGIPDDEVSLGMLGYLITALIAFGFGFLAAGLMAAGRRGDTAQADFSLADAVDAFSAEYDDRRFDVGNRVAVSRSRLDQLAEALAVHDELRSS